MVAYTGGCVLFCSVCWPVAVRRKSTDAGVIRGYAALRLSPRIPSTTLAHDIVRNADDTVLVVSTDTPLEERAVREFHGEACQREPLDAGSTTRWSS